MNCIAFVERKYGLSVKESPERISYYDSEAKTIFIDFDYTAGSPTAYCELEIVLAHEIGHHLQHMSGAPSSERDAWERGTEVAKELRVLEEYMRRIGALEEYVRSWGC